MREGNGGDGAAGAAVSICCVSWFNVINDGWTVAVSLDGPALAAPLASLFAAAALVRGRLRGGGG